MDQCQGGGLVTSAMRNLARSVKSLWSRQTLESVAMPAHRYIADGMRPWSPDYLAYREFVVAGILARPSALARFATGEPLPDGYGVGVDERCVEYPWSFARLAQSRGRVLDAGSTLNYAHLLKHPSLSERAIDMLTLAPEVAQQYHRGPSYLFADLRDLPIRDGWYDAIACISTLEHVGLDNTTATGDARYLEERPSDFALAVRELRRVLRPGGTLLLTVPYGRYKNMGWQQLFDARLVADIVTAFGAVTHPDVTYYRYTLRGWQVSTAEACDDADYVSWIADAWYTGHWPDPLPVEADHAAAARAVACIALTRPSCRS